jgi:hypothetical protein
VYLYGPNYQVSLDPSFAADITFGGGGGGGGGIDQGQDRKEGGKFTEGKEEEAAVEQEKGHLMWAAGGWDFMLEAGEVLFVPAGCAHSVGNVTDTVAISANYVDDSNLSMAVRELEFTSAEDPRVKVPMCCQCVANVLLMCC